MKIRTHLSNKDDVSQLSDAAPRGDRVEGLITSLLPYHRGVDRALFSDGTQVGRFKQRKRPKQPLGYITGQKR